MKHLTEMQEFQEFDNLELIARQIVEGFITGLHRSPYHGFSVEFAEHRLYNPGESTKHIDWKLFAKSDRLFVKQYEEETNLRCQLVLDCTSSMLFPYHPSKKNVGLNKLAYSVYCCSSLIYMLRKQRDAVGLSLFDQEITEELLPRLSASHVECLYAHLSTLLHSVPKSDLKKKGNTAQTLHEIAERIHKRSLVVLFSDLINEDPEEFLGALQHLRYNKHEVIVFHVVDHSLEKSLEYDARPHLFVDLETGDEIKMNPQEFKEAFAKQSLQHIKALKEQCWQFQIDFVEADIQKDFHETIWAFLQKRNMLY